MPLTYAFVILTFFSTLFCLFDTNICLSFLLVVNDFEAKKIKTYATNKKKASPTLPKIVNETAKDSITDKAAKHVVSPTSQVPIPTRKVNKNIVGLSNKRAKVKGVDNTGC